MIWRHLLHMDFQKEFHDRLLFTRTSVSHILSTRFFPGKSNMEEETLELLLLYCESFWHGFHRFCCCNSNSGKNFTGHRVAASSTPNSGIYASLRQARRFFCWFHFGAERKLSSRTGQVLTGDCKSNVGLLWGRRMHSSICVVTGNN